MKIPSVYQSIQQSLKKRNLIAMLRTRSSFILGGKYLAMLNLDLLKGKKL